VGGTVASMVGGTVASMVGGTASETVRDAVAGHRSLDLDPHRAALLSALALGVRAQMVLDGHLRRQEQLALSVEEVHLRLWRDELVDQMLQAIGRLSEEP
jgi:hypothetical protein